LGLPHRGRQLRIITTIWDSGQPLIPLGAPCAPGEIGECLNLPCPLAECGDKLIVLVVRAPVGVVHE
jgi:hypothetical protein